MMLFILQINWRCVLIKYVPHTTTAVTVKPRVVTVEEMTFVTMWLVTVLMDVHHIGLHQDAMVGMEWTYCYALLFQQLFPIWNWEIANRHNTYLIAFISLIMVFWLVYVLFYISDV